MGARKQTTAVAAELNNRIAVVVENQNEVARLNAEIKADKTAIQTLMEDAELPRFATAAGAEALLIDKPSFAWNVEKLRAFLTRSMFIIHCPIKPNGTKLTMLRKSLEQTDEKEDLKGLDKCAKITTKTNLSVRAAIESSNEGELK